MHLIPPAPVVGTSREPLLPEFNGAPQQLLSFFFRRRTGHTPLVAVVPKNEDLRFSFGEDELGGHPTLPVILEWHGSGKSQSQAAGLEHRSVSFYQRVVGLSSIVESGAASDGNLHRSPDAANAAVDMTILTGVGRQPDRQEVFQLGNSVRQQEARNQDVRGRPIELLVPHAIRVGSNSETAAVFVIQDRPENAGRVKVWVAVPVERAVHAYQGNCPHVADDSVILDRLIGHRSVPSLCSEMS